MSAFTFAPPPEFGLQQQRAGDAVLALERPQDSPLVDSLVDRAFGPGRYAKTAERLRETAALSLDLSVCAWAGGSLVGTVRQWPIRIGDQRALFLGPIAVEHEDRRQGLGAALMRQAIDVGAAAGWPLVLLVGDQPYFGQFGFEPVPEGRVTLPGPVDPRRVLWRPLAGALDGVSGPAVGLSPRSPRR